MTARLHLVEPALATVTPITDTVFDRAMRIALSAENDWGKQLAAARTLAESPDWKHQNLARHIRDAHALHEAGLLQPVPVIHRDKSDMVDAWKGQAVAVTPPPYSAGHGTIRRVIIGTAAFVSVAWLGLVGWLA